MLSKQPFFALIATRIAFVGIALIPVFSYHLSICISCRNANKILNVGYIAAILFFIPLSWTSLILDGIYTYSWGFFFRAGRLHPIFMAFFIYFMISAFLNLFLSVRRETKPLERNRKKYFLISLFIAYIGSIDYLPTYGVKVYPFGYLTLICFVLVFAYAILKYSLMDINIALTRAGIFVFVYLFVLGVPFWLGYKYGLWQYATWLMLVLATAGPFIYQYLNKQAEELILKEQKQYQKALLETSSKMLLIKELDRLLKTAGITIIETVKVSFVGIYIEDEKTMKYTARYTQAGEGKSELPKEFSPESELVRHLCANKLPIIGEEVSGSSYKIGLAVPLIIGDLLLGFMLLGEKPQGRVYTQDDVNVFTILANQIAMAIENCQFYEQEKERQALLYQSATLAQMGVMADSMGHQIKNHIQKMAVQAGAQAGILEELLKEDISREKAVELLKRHLQIFTKIEAQGKTGGELIASISKFSKLPRGEFKQTTIAEMLATANDMLRFKIKFERIDYAVDIADTLPQIYAHPILGEAFFNLIDNSYDSILDREDRLKESGYRGRIAFQARCGNSTHVEIKIADNGMGIDEKILEHLFLPFYTTKATANKGQGLGLFVIKKIVDNHKGSITVDSKRLNGTTFTILLPIKANV